MALTLYIVCHKAWFPANYADYTADDVRDMLRWYVVDESTPKTVDCPPECRVDEWELPAHDPFQQLSGFYNNSALWHVYANPELHSDFVGFAQYDMTVPRASLAAFRDAEGVGRVAYMFPCAFDEFMRHSAVPETLWRTMASQVAKAVGTDWDADADWATLCASNVPLFHGFILPKAAFLAMMDFASCVMNDVVRALRHDTRHLAGTLERVCALWIAVAVQKRRLGPVTLLDGCTHNHDTQRDIDLGIVDFASSVMNDVVRALKHDTRLVAGTLKHVHALSNAVAAEKRRLGPVVTHKHSRRISDAVQQYSADDVHRGTDKLTGHSYGPVYDAAFAAYDPAAPLDILELGVLTGGFTAALLDYFPAATVRGVDLCFDELGPWDLSRAKLVKADATTPGLFPGDTFDIVIDDASHAPDEQAALLELYAPRLKPGGTYVVEDIDGKHADRVRRDLQAGADRHGLSLQWHDLRHVKGRFDDIAAVLRRP